jgi:hypothetical protein
MGGKSRRVGGEGAIACFGCGHRFALSEGMSRRTVERYGEEYERAPGTRNCRRSWTP